MPLTPCELPVDYPGVVWPSLLQQIITLLCAGCSCWYRHNKSCEPGGPSRPDHVTSILPVSLSVPHLFCCQWWPLWPCGWPTWCEPCFPPRFSSQEPVCQPSSNLLCYYHIICSSISASPGVLHIRKAPRWLPSGADVPGSQLNSTPSSRLPCTPSRSPWALDFWSSTLFTVNTSTTLTFNTCMHCLHIGGHVFTGTIIVGPHPAFAVRSRFTLDA